MHIAHMGFPGHLFNERHSRSDAHGIPQYRSAVMFWWAILLPKGNFSAKCSCPPLRSPGNFTQRLNSEFNG
jgi:hypothetical protein